MGFFKKLSEGLKKTKENFTQKVEAIFKVNKEITDELYDELEEALIVADVGINTAIEICENLRKKVKQNKLKFVDEVKDALKETIVEMLEGGEQLNINTKPSIILVIGVNGVGKTTTIGKIAYNIKQSGKSVLLGAADTFRAAAIEQLDEWSKRADVPMIKQEQGSDPASVVFDTISSAKAKGIDVAICDTAGRLHNKKNLMDELSKISRVISREAEESDVEILLVLDATTGQNAINQAKSFKEAAGITGIVLTKLDGTARGGVVIAIKQELEVPIKYIGVGEQLEDLQPFNAKEFVDALFVNDDKAKDDEAKQQDKELSQEV